MRRALVALAALLAACAPITPPTPPQPISVVQGQTFDCQASWVESEQTAEFTLGVLACGGRTDVASVDACLNTLRAPNVHDDTIYCTARDLQVMGSIAVARGTASAETRAVAANFKTWILTTEVKFR